MLKVCLVKLNSVDGNETRFVQLNMFCCLQGLIAAHDQFKCTLDDADKEFNAIIALMIEVGRICKEYGVIGSVDNPYTELTTEV